jgi:hypothetical protein
MLKWSYVDGLCKDSVKRTKSCKQMSVENLGSGL